MYGKKAMSTMVMFRLLEKLGLAHEASDEDGYWKDEFLRKLFTVVKRDE